MVPDILQQIVAEKWRELRITKQQHSLDDMAALAYQADPVRGFKSTLRKAIDLKQPAVIAEIKKASPSKGCIRAQFDPEQIAKSYQKAGASCLSILTDQQFFQGNSEYLRSARAVVDLPVLRKDFIVDPYQVFESRALNADCILLIVSILGDQQLQELHSLAVSLGMSVLVEVHNRAELERALRITPDILGINNRNLRTFEVTLATTLELMQWVYGPTLLVTESGIHSQHDVKLILDSGVYGFLVGEACMRHPDPGEKLLELFATYCSYPCESIVSVTISTDETRNIR